MPVPAYLEWRRKFLRFDPADSPSVPLMSRIALPNVDAAVKILYEMKYSYPAFSLAGGDLLPARISPWTDQHFPIAATAFERDWSLLCGYGYLTPVVDGELYVVAHVGEISDDDRVIFVPLGRRFGDLRDILAAGKPVFVSKRNPDPAKFEDKKSEGRQFSYRLMMDLDGRVVAFLSERSRDGLESPAIDPLDLIGVAQIGVSLGAGIARYAARATIRRAAAGGFRRAINKLEGRLLARGAQKELPALRLLSEEELARVWGGARPSLPLTDNQLDKAIELLRLGKDVHVESIGQMRQIQAELGQLGVRSESSSAIIPQRPAVTKIAKPDGTVTEVRELDGSFRDGAGTYRRDPPHGPGKAPYNPHNEYPHINITLRSGKTLCIMVTGTKSF